jgi:hypothetical protein
LQNVLKWKLRPISPIVVRHIIENSGFKLVRSELCLVNNLNNPSVTKDQCHQNYVSLQKHYGVTPPIFDVFSGFMTLPRSREFIFHIFSL